MRDEHVSRLALRWWEIMRPSERIVAMALATSGIVAILSSTVWAAAACFASYQRARAAIACADLQRLGTPDTLGTTHEIMGGRQ